jgi:hypothetical protein
MYKTALDKTFLSIENSKACTITDNNLELTFSLQHKEHTLEDDIVDVETPRINSQPKCVVIGGV